MTSNTFMKTLKNELAGTSHTSKGSLAYNIDGMVDYTEKNAVEIEGALVYVWNQLINGSSFDTVKNAVDTIVNKVCRKDKSGKHYENHESVRAYYLELLIIMWAETRDIRGTTGGKGWKDGGYWMWISLARHFPMTMMSLYHLFPKYGSWKDYQKMYDLFNTINKDGEILDNEFCEKMLNYTIDIWVNQLQSDLENVELNNQISLCVKYVPKESRSLDKKYKVVNKICCAMFPTLPYKKSRPLYRKMCSKLNKYIDTVEIKMCAGNKDESIWGSIDFNKVSGRAMKIYKSAFLNLPNKKNNTEEIRSHLLDRANCATNLKTHIDNKLNSGEGIKSRQYIHEIISEVRKVNKDFIVVSKAVADVVELQWTTEKNRILNSIKESGVKPGNILMISDYSGSMDAPDKDSSGHGRPMSASIALGIFTSEILAEFNPVWGNVSISFSNKPKFIKYTHPDGSEMSLFEKVDTALKSEWGGNTDYLAVYDLILGHAIKHKLTQDQLPETLITASDMEFDSAHDMHTFAHGEYKTLCSLGGEVGNFFRSIRDGNYSNLKEDYAPMHKIIKDAFHEAGKLACGEPYKMIKTVYWNLAGNKTTFPVNSNAPDTMMISGFNVNILNSIITNQDIEKFTPWDNLVKTMEDERYCEILKITRDVLEEPHLDYEL